VNAAASDADKARASQEKAADAEVKAATTQDQKEREAAERAAQREGKADVKANAPTPPEVPKLADDAKLDDADKIVSSTIEETAFNTEAKDVKLEDAYSGTLHKVVDPFRKDAEDPFTHDGFVGVDPSQAHVNETRRPDPENDDVKVG
jgi:hypothetical protein